MIERLRTLRVLPLIGVLWMALIVVESALRLTVPAGGLPIPPLPAGYALASVALEGALLFVAIGILAVPLTALAIVRSRASRPGRVAAAAGQHLLLIGFAFAVASSWVSYRIAGRFLDRETAAFLLEFDSSVSHFLLRAHPFVGLGLPFVLIAAAVIFGESVPSWFRRVPSNADRWIVRTTLVGLVLSAILAAGGHLGSGMSGRRIEDPVFETTRSLSEVFSLQRSDRSGPFSHLLPRRTEPAPLFANEHPEELYLLYCQWKRLRPGFLKYKGRKVRDPFERHLAGTPPEMIRRPIVTMESYVAGVDRGRLKRWNVVLVLLDSFRTDALRVLGGSREVMPLVDAMAAEGAAFSDCTTSAPQTNYAMPSAHSSHYPLRHPQDHRYPKSPTYPRVLIYDILKALGWKTAFFSSGDENWCQMANYYDTGGLDFFFHAADPVGVTAPEDLRLSAIGCLDDRVTISESLKWIDRRGDAPFFVSLILKNCHSPYPVPADYPRRFGPATVDFEFKQGGFPRDKTAVARQLYEDSLGYVDLQLGRIVRHLKERGEWDRTVMVVTGDHGEAFFEHGFPAHANTLFEEASRVPLVIRAPGLTPIVDPRPAELIDLPPSLGHLLGLPVHPSFQGENLFAPNPRPDRIRPVVLQLGWCTLLSVTQSGYKLIRDAGSGATMLFNLSEDPGETKNVAVAHPMLVGKLARWMAFWRKAQLDYYQNPALHSTEYPPVLREP